MTDPDSDSLWSGWRVGLCERPGVCMERQAFIGGIFQKEKGKKEVLSGSLENSPTTVAPASFTPPPHHRIPEAMEAECSCLQPQGGGQLILLPGPSRGCTLTPETPGTVRTQTYDPVAAHLAPAAETESSCLQPQGRSPLPRSTWHPNPQPQVKKQGRRSPTSTVSAMPQSCSNP